MSLYQTIDRYEGMIDILEEYAEKYGDYLNNNYNDKHNIINLHKLLIKNMEEMKNGQMPHAVPNNEIRKKTEYLLGQMTILRSFLIVYIPIAKEEINECLEQIKQEIKEINKKSLIK
jgi:hypothetical protein